jgi:hypothetical protein
VKIRKRYILLVVLGLFPFYRFVHTENYCFGDIDLVIVAGLTLFYIIAFLSISFFNLYKITIKKELFNFTPLIITFVFSMTLYYTLEYHNKPLFKNKVQVFKSTSKQEAVLEINLYDNNTFELKTINPKSFCVEKGVYSYKQDTLFLGKSNIVDGNIFFGDVYIYNETYHSLNPIYTGLPIFTLKK